MSLLCGNFASMFSPLFNYLRLFRDIPQAGRDFIEQYLAYRCVKEGEVLLQAGKTARELFFICKGVIKITAANDKGRDVTYFFLRENQFTTILNSFNNNVPSGESIIAACDAEVIAISKTALMEVYEKMPYIRELITGIQQQALLDKLQLRNAFLGEDAAARYKLFLMRQADIALRVPLSDVASYLGVTQQSLSRIRRTAK
jgi:CRP-like cAMP-binding protein